MVINQILIINWLFGLVVFKFWSFGLFLLGLSHNPVSGLNYQFWLWFSVYGVGPVSWFPQKPYIITISPFWPHLPVIQSLPDWGVCASSLACLCHGSVYCASMPEVCHHVRGSSPKCLSFPGCARGPRCPERPRHGACTYGIIFVWNIILFYLSWDDLLDVCIAILMLSLSDCPYSLVRLGLAMASIEFSLWFI